jgi:hypothetical protein
MRTLAAALALAAALLPSCASPLPNTELPPARMVADAPYFPGVRDYRGVVDLRIKAAGLDQVAVADIARQAQIDFVFLADRADTPAPDYGIGGFTNEILFIPGGSFAAPDGGEILGFNLTDAVDPGLAPDALLAAIRAQGAIAAVGRSDTFGAPAHYALADALEVYNFEALWRARQGGSLYLSALFTGADRFFRTFDERSDDALAAYDRMAAGARVTLFAAMGAVDEISVLGARVGTLDQRLLVFTTHVFSTQRQLGLVVESFRRGHVYVTFDILGYVPTFAFYAQHGDRRVMMGGEIALEPGVVLKTELHAEADRIVLLANGVEVKSAENSRTLEHAPTVPAAYRVEAYRSGLPWIYSNPVYVR